MFRARHLGTFWLAAVALLALAEVTHFVGHLNVIPQTSHSHHDHQHGHHHHGHPHDSQPSDPDVPAERGHLAEHSHSPAIVDAYSLIRACALVQSSVAEYQAVPEAPVQEIDYPPQLS